MSLSDKFQVAWAWKDGRFQKVTEEIKEMIRKREKEEGDTMNEENEPDNKKGTHLRFKLRGSPAGHPQKIMKDLGIEYQHATPQSLYEQWWFWNCENIPEPLPEYLSILKLEPIEAIGYGLSVEDAANIVNGKK